MTTTAKEDKSEGSAVAGVGEMENKEAAAPAPPPKEEEKQILMVAELSFHDENAVPTQQKDKASCDKEAGKEQNRGFKVLNNIRRSLTAEKDKSPMKEHPSSAEAGQHTQEPEVAVKEKDKERGYLAKMVGKFLTTSDASTLPTEQEETAGASDESAAAAAVSTENAGPSTQDKEKSEQSKTFLAAVKSLVARGTHPDKATKGETKPTAETAAEEAKSASNETEGKAKDSRAPLQIFTNFFGRSTRDAPDQTSGTTREIEEPVAVDAATKDAPSPTRAMATLTMEAICRKTAGFVHGMEETVQKAEDKLQKLGHKSKKPAENEGENSDDKREGDKVHERPAVVDQVINGIKMKLQQTKGKQTDKSAEPVAQTEVVQPQEKVKGSPASPRWMNRMSGIFVKSSSSSHMKGAPKTASDEAAQEGAAAKPEGESASEQAARKETSAEI